MTLILVGTDMAHVRAPKVVKLWWMGWAGHTSRIKYIKNPYKMLLGLPEAIWPRHNLDVNRRVILKRILKKLCVKVQKAFNCFRIRFHVGCCEQCNDLSAPGRKRNILDRRGISSFSNTRPIELKCITNDVITQRNSSLRSFCWSNIIEDLSRRNYSRSSSSSFLECYSKTHLTIRHFWIPSARTVELLAWKNILKQDCISIQKQLSFKWLE
jgi:hypothetical protein